MTTTHPAPATLPDPTRDPVEAAGHTWTALDDTDALIGHETAVALLSRPDEPEVTSEPLTAGRCPECGHAYWSSDTVCSGVLSEDRLELVDHDPCQIVLDAAVA